ncbi:MAG: adenine phosphoribosyltransferase [Spirochaetes bacterium]|nr:adenine phosphoribosyltransferase [Spirochaetota bacterium]
MNLESLIRNVPDFPKPGIQFKDITTLLQDPKGFQEAIDQLAAPFTDMDIDAIAGIESRGFIFGAPMAMAMNLPFILIRKPGKLPARTISQSYSLEYGTDTIEMHEDAVEKGEKVLVFDDLLATGGTAKAACNLIEKAGGTVSGIAFVIELTGSLHGRDMLKGYDIISLVDIPVEE